MAFTDLLIRKAIPSQKPCNNERDQVLFPLVNPSGSNCGVKNTC
ncbi:hypothetical protein [Ferrovum sp.]|nr:hypothetical protein [Ferrovum sp.]